MIFFWQWSLTNQSNTNETLIGGSGTGMVTRYGGYYDFSLERIKGKPIVLVDGIDIQTNGLEITINGRMPSWF